MHGGRPWAAWMTGIELLVSEHCTNNVRDYQPAQGGPQGYRVYSLLVADMYHQQR